MPAPTRSLAYSSAKYALLSRFAVVGLQAVANALVTDYDTSGLIDNKELSPTPLVLLAGGLTHWDASYMIRIAQHGYEHEQNFAFFPLFPLAARCFALCIHSTGMLNWYSSIVLGSVLCANACFVGAAVGLAFLVRSLVRSEELALTCALLFAVNPASIFFSAAYSESLYALLSFWGFYFLAEQSQRQQHRSTTRLGHALPAAAGTVCLSLSALARGNGFVNLAYVVYLFAEKLHLHYTARADSPDDRRRRTRKGAHIVAEILPSLGVTLLQCALIALPFLLLQHYAYSVFCTGSDPELVRPWCSSFPPFIYSFVQSTYWNNGFLKYYQAKQVPNFLLALPIALLSLHGCASLLRHFRESGRWKRWILQGTPVAGQVWTTATLPFVLQMLALTLICLLFMHVQVMTRFLCASSPAVYLAAAGIVSDRSSRTGRALVYGYFLSFAALGCILFSNFYPWT